MLRRGNFGFAGRVARPPEFVLIENNALRLVDFDELSQPLRDLINEYGAGHVKTIARVIHQDDPSRLRQLLGSGIEQFAAICETYRRRKQKTLLIEAANPLVTSLIACGG